MNVCFNGFKENTVTFEAGAAIDKGAPVMITDNGTVSAASGKFCGFCAGYRDGYAAVQLSGYVRASYSGTAPAVGFTKLSASSGKVAADNSNGREYLVTDVDTTGKTVGIIL